MSLTEKLAKTEENVICAGPGRRAKLRRRRDGGKVTPMCWRALPLRVVGRTSVLSYIQNTAVVPPEIQVGAG